MSPIPADRGVHPALAALVEEFGVHRALLVLAETVGEGVAQVIEAELVGTAGVGTVEKRAMEVVVRHANPSAADGIDIGLRVFRT